MPSVSDSVVINAPADKTWAMIREFNGLPRWLPFVTASEIEGGGDANTAGAIRRLTTDEGGTIRETLLELSDAERYLKYDVIESEMPLRNYIGMARVTPEGEDRSRLEWTSTWENDPEVEEELVDLFGKTLLPKGLAAAKAALER